MGRGKGGSFVGVRGVEEGGEEEVWEAEGMRGVCVQD